MSQPKNPDTRIYSLYIRPHMTVEDFVPPPPRLTLEPILRFQRYRSVEQVAPPILDVARDMLALAEKLVDPRVAFVTRAVEAVGPDAVAVVGGPTFHGRCLGTHLGAAREAACFVLTLGPALDTRVDELSDGDDLLEALFLDSAGWLAIEDSVRALRAHLRARARPRGLRLSPRLGPGYMDWPLAEQAPFFSLFGAAELPVSLSEYCVMSPKKSISGLFGFLPAG